jgi:hypothetical protein
MAPTSLDALSRASGLNPYTGLKVLPDLYEVSPALANKMIENTIRTALLPEIERMIVGRSADPPPVQVSVPVPATAPAPAGVAPPASDAGTNPLAIALGYAALEAGVQNAGKNRTKPDRPKFPAFPAFPGFPSPPTGSQTGGNSPFKFPAFPPGPFPGFPSPPAGNQTGGNGGFKFPAFPNSFPPFPAGNSSSPFPAPAPLQLGVIPQIFNTPEVLAGLPLSWESMALGNVGGDRRNELNGPCKNVTLIFARGVTEQGNMGVIVGPGFAKELQRAGISAAVQGLNFDPMNLKNGSQAGGALMAQNANDVAARCPNTKIILGGYSIGGVVIPIAAWKLKKEVHKQIVAIITFGWPPGSLKMIPKDLQRRARAICKSDDMVCGGKGHDGTGNHLSYGNTAKLAAQFVKQQLLIP